MINQSLFEKLTLRIFYREDYAYFIVKNTATLLFNSLCLIYKILSLISQK